MINYLSKLSKPLVCAATMLFALSCGGATDSDAELRMMSFNMRYENLGDGLTGEHSWSQRRARIAAMLDSVDCDVIGTQELLLPQLEYMREHLSDYTSVGVARENGIDRGEHSAIFYRTERFEMIKSGNFWLSETPDSIGCKGWDAACERIATWVRLRDRATEEEFVVMNLHADHAGELARVEGMKLVVARCQEYAEGAPVILMGDFNATPESEPVSVILQSGIFSDSRVIAQSTSGVDYTFSNYGKIPAEKRVYIDYIFVTEGVEVISNETIGEEFDGGYMSDHNPVMVDVMIK